MKRWDATEDRRLLALVASGKSWHEISSAFGITIAACDGRWRKIRTRPEQTERPNAHRRINQDRTYKNLKPHNNPDEPDSSSVKFASCADHLQHIARANAGKGYPVLAVERFRRAA
jgi:hypothetical protein